MASGSRPNVLEDSCGLRNVQNLPEEQRAALSDDQRSALHGIRRLLAESGEQCSGTQSRCLGVCRVIVETAR